MIIKGILNICKGIFSSNELTFEDAAVSPPVTLRKTIEDHHSGWFNLPLGQIVEIDFGKVSLNTSYEKQGGYIKHCGFIKGSVDVS